MNLRFFGHAAVGLTPSPGAGLPSVLLDPYQPGGFGGQIGYGPIDFDPGLILITHEHLDHNHCAPFPGAPRLGPEHWALGSWPDHGLRLRALRVAHDACGGQRRGGHSWCLSLRMEGMQVVHLGDIGETPPQDQLERLTGGEPVDVLLATCGGHFTIGAWQAAEVALRLRARLIVPIHYRTAGCTLPHMQGVDELLRHLPGHRRHRGPLHLSADSLPQAGSVVVIEPEALPRP